jgi:hypothetical protein
LNGSRSPGDGKGDALEETRFLLWRTSLPASFSNRKPNISKSGALFCKYFQRFLWAFCEKSEACGEKKEIFAFLQTFAPIAV